MVYEMFFHPRCLEDIRKCCKKNHVLEQALKKKINEIIENPQHYKPLRYNLVGVKRVHILKSYVLTFDVDEKDKIVRFLFFGHHDEAYQ